MVKTRAELRKSRFPGSSCSSTDIIHSCFFISNFGSSQACMIDSGNQPLSTSSLK